jgi:hypothetical protein
LRRNEPISDPQPAVDLVDGSTDDATSPSAARARLALERFRRILPTCNLYRYGSTRFDATMHNLIGEADKSDDKSEDDGDANKEGNSDLRAAAEKGEWYHKRTIRDSAKKTGPWSSDERERYGEGLEMYRYGSWKLIADHVGTRSVRQVTSHAQSIRLKRKRAEECETRNQKESTPSAACASERPTTNKSAGRRDQQRLLRLQWTMHKNLGES